MRLLGAFLTHEMLIQRRSVRARFIAFVHVAGGLAPVLTFRLAAPDVSAVAYPVALQLLLPMLTFLAAAALSLDGIAREREEGAMQVIGLTPMTNAGYVLRRWIALTLPVLAVSLVPVAVTLGLALAAPASRPDVGAFLWPWVLQCVPAAVLGSAVGIGFGTMAGGPILAIIQALLLGSLVLSFGNDLLSRTGRVLDGSPPWLRAQLVGVPFAGGRNLGNFVRYEMPGVELTDAPIDLPGDVEASLAGLAFLVTFAALALSPPVPASLAGMLTIAGHEALAQRHVPALVRAKLRLSA